MVAVTFERETIDFDALVVAALPGGEWSKARATVVAGLGAQTRGSEPDPVSVRELEDGFRRARGLWAAEDLTQWLSARGVTVADWRAHLRRVAVASSDGSEAQPEPAAHGDDAISVARLALLLEGGLRAAGERLLAGAAAEALLGEELQAPDDLHERVAMLARAAVGDPLLPLEDRDPDAVATAAERVIRLTDAHDRLCDRVETALVWREVIEHGARWTRLEYESLSVASESAAREAIMCVREDGLALAAVAKLAGTAVHARMVIAEDAPGTARDLHGARRGEPVGPVRADDGFRVLVLVDRHRPEPEDPDIAARARAAIARERIDRRLDGRVRWHVEL